jgi:hypothetical protein
MGKYHCTIDLLLDWFGLLCFAKKKIVSGHTADSKPVEQEVNGTVTLPPLVFPGEGHQRCYGAKQPACLPWPPQHRYDYFHGDKTRVQTPTKMFPHVKL